MNFIIRILCHFTTACSSVKTFETTRSSEVAIFDHYEIHIIDFFEFLDIQWKHY